MYEPNHDVVQKAKAKYIAWVLARMENPSLIPAWTGYNQKAALNNSNVSVIGPLPLLDAVSHDFDTIWTVLKIVWP